MPNTLHLLRNFRVTTLPKVLAGHIDIKVLIKWLYAVIAMWNYCVGIFLGCLFAAYEYRFTATVYVPSKASKEKETTTTVQLFGEICTLDIPPQEFPCVSKIESAVSNSNCRHGWFPSVVKGCKLHYRCFLPPHVERPKAIIIWMHGLQGSGGEAHILNTSDNSLQKTNMALQADVYLKQGYAVYAMDMLGHGWSEGKRWYMPNGETMLADYIRFIQGVNSLYKQQQNDNSDMKAEQAIPLFLSGYSYGGCLTLKAASYFQTYPQDAPKGFQGIILQAPAINNLEIFYFGPLVAWTVRNIINPILGANFTPPKWMFNRVHPKRFWRNPQRYRVGMEDNGMNAVGRHIPMQTCLTLVEEMIRLRNEVIPTLQVPFCVVHGHKDQVIPLSGSQYLMRASLTPREDQSHLFFPEAYHDLLAEPEANAAMEFQVNWIKERLAIWQQQQKKYP